MVQNIRAVLCRTADADNPPGAAGDQSLWVDKKAAAALQRGSLRALAAKLLGDTAHIRARKMAPSGYCHGKEMRTRQSVQGEGKQGISKGRRRLYVTCQGERLTVLR